MTRAQLVVDFIGWGHLCSWPDAMECGIAFVKADSRNISQKIVLNKHLNPCSAPPPRLYSGINTMLCL